jgi:hypothetical protein
MNVLVLGASGFVGRHLADALRTRGDVVRAASLRDPRAAAQSARGCDAIVNLAGAPVAQRWTQRAKRDIAFSRIEAPQQFLDAVGTFTDRPKAYISASAIGYYGTSETQTFVESSAAGSDFLARVCVEWERVAGSARNLGMRVACVRTGLALGKDGGVLKALLVPFNLGAGGPIGSGKQWYSWIHIGDLVAIYLLALDGAEGALNAGAPNPVTNREFATTLGSVLHRPAVVPTPSFALRLIFGEGADAMLSGQRVLPERTTSLGYVFKQPHVREALESLLT